MGNARNLVMTRDEFKRQLTELNNKVILWGSSFYTVWKTLLFTKGAVDVINSHKEFFITALEACRRTAIIDFCKVFDGDSKTISLRKLLKYARENPTDLVPRLDVDKLREEAKRLRKHSRLIAKLKVYRDQHIAHLDALPSPNTELLVKELDELLEDLKSIFNALGKGHSGESWWFERLDRECERKTKYVLGAINKEAEWRKKASPEELHEYLGDVWNFGK